MVESKIRKAAFLREACRQLEIEDAVVETGRYEALLARPEFHEVHDLLTVRAVRVEARVLRELAGIRGRNLQILQLEDEFLL